MPGDRSRIASPTHLCTRDVRDNARSTHARTRAADGDDDDGRWGEGRLEDGVLLFGVTVTVTTTTPGSSFFSFSFSSGGCGCGSCPYRWVVAWDDMSRRSWARIEAFSGRSRKARDQKRLGAVFATVGVRELVWGVRLGF